jgi:hypothetical protein
VFFVTLSAAIQIFSAWAQIILKPLAFQGASLISAVIIMLAFRRDALQGLWVCIIQVAAITRRWRRQGRWTRLHKVYR